MKILIATDGSKHSLTAIEKCCALACAAEKIEFKIVAVYQAYMAADAFPMVSAYSEEYEQTIRRLTEKSVADAAAQIEKCLPEKIFEISTKVCCGAPDQEIVETAQSWNADLIVVGSHGRGFWGRAMLGSVSDAVIHQAPCSVLVVKTQGENK